MLISDQNVGGKFYIQIQSQIYAYTHIYSIFTYVFGTIATKLIDTYSLITTVTLTAKFQGHMINCLCL